ncbi:MAG: glycosyltransferase family 2 protein [Rhodopirellula sp. JB044]|uniref:glycosyltransferase family 2 protein n=1 Tax=Rhodopirellula sp. JB044 TaxID=3342844 RepID=UPI00370AB250
MIENTPSDSTAAEDVITEGASVEVSARDQAIPNRTPELTIVVPAMNEEDSLATLHSRLVDVCGAACGEAADAFEIVFIDDGSTDSTWERMVTLSEGDYRTKAIRLRRNFGKAAALSAGFSVARGDIVFTMDADLQDDPDEIPRFLSALSGRSDEGAGAAQEDARTKKTPAGESAAYRSDRFVSTLDVVSGWKRVRHDPWHKVLPSRVFNALVSGITGVRLHDHNCGFKAYRREVLAELDLYGERHRFIPVLAAARGWKVGEIEVQHHPRAHGKSKYGLSRLGKGFLDLMSIYLLTDYARRPLHLIGSAGLVSFGLGTLGLLYLSAMWVITRLGEGDVLHLHSTAIFYYCILAILFGAQCVLAGLIAELIVSVSAARDRSLRGLQKGPGSVFSPGGVFSPDSVCSSGSGTASNLALHHVSYSVSQIAGFGDRSVGGGGKASAKATG